MNRLLPLGVVAQFLGTTRNNVRALLEDGMPTVRIPTAGGYARRVPISGLLAWMRRHSEGAPADAAALAADLERFLAERRKGGTRAGR